MSVEAELPLHRATGVTASERYLGRLCERSFLSLWSYPGVFRDQGRGSGRGDGKEVCDLLVVFGNHILIFSDKQCEFGDSGDLATDWSRWYRKAVLGGAKQVWGAERWIRDHPDKLFLDRQCTRPFPLPVPDPASATFHRIVVAHGAAARCRAELGGSGSLMLAPDSDETTPFTVGVIDPRRPFVHVLDDTTVDILLSTLDTVSDFVEYLTKKEQLVAKGRLAFAAGEEDLLAYYLRHIDKQGGHTFHVPGGFTAISIDEGHWETWANSERRQAQRAADRISYSWDTLIEKFAYHAATGTQYFKPPGGIDQTEIILRVMASESRTRRRMLARSLHEVLERSETEFRSARVMAPGPEGGPHYVFLALGQPEGASEAEYRDVRRRLLNAYCMAVKVRWPNATDIVGIATERGLDRASRSEDSAYLDARSWTPEHQAEAEALQRDLGLFREHAVFRTVEREFPERTRGGWQSHTTHAPVMKGRNRNDPCPCGSGRKYKRCCGAHR